MNNPANDLVTAINDSLGLELRPAVSMNELRSRLAGRIHELINGDFNKLVSILYRVDINETKLRQLLDKDAAADAGLIIAELIIERQLQKARHREQFRATGENNIDENEKW